VLVGIDEQTGMVSTDGDRWICLGAGVVTLYHGGRPTVYRAGEEFSVDERRQ
jgi:hypothetical protein